MEKNVLSLQELYEEYADSLFRFAFFRLDGDRESALDYIQEAFYKLWKSLQEKREIENPRAYLYRIVTNLIIDGSRKDTPFSLEEHIESTGIEPSYMERENEKLSAKMEVEKIYALLATLGSWEREIFILRYVEELSPAEIAEIYGKSVNAITVRLHRLKQRITSEFSTHY